mmetsp:Transcript_5630/g.9703  ORF Transcript_5630/g.9703 Transcript_5630/m.9703 type:complete len:107 (-) Transcript_5630:109-429(-)
MAILIHKIPASLGLGSFLSHARVENYFRHILCFTLCSPLFNLATFLLLSSTMTREARGSKSSQLNVTFEIGVLLLVSAGTFLHVSTILILPQASKPNSRDCTEEQT